MLTANSGDKSAQVTAPHEQSVDLLFRDKFLPGMNSTGSAGFLTEKYKYLESPARFGLFRGSSERIPGVKIGQNLLNAPIDPAYLVRLAGDVIKQQRGWLIDSSAPHMWYRRYE